MSEKAGARHNRNDQQIINGWHKRADELKTDMEALGAAIEEATDAAQKAGDVPDAAEPATILGVVKAAGDWELDVLANPYGGPVNGRDADGQYFSPNTKFHEDQIPLPPVVYYHGYGDDKRPSSVPEFIGKTIKRWVDSRGVWYRVLLDKGKARAKLVMEAAHKQAARASTGVVLASHRVDQKTGEILSWLNGELSIFETHTGKKPANGYAVALPALKAVYDQAGLALPDFTEPNATPQTDATGAASPVAVARSTDPSKRATETYKMDKELQDAINAQIIAAFKMQKDAEAAETERQAKEQARIDAAVAAEKAKNDEAIAAMKAQYAAGGRLPIGEAPHQTKFASTAKYDHLSVDDMSFMAGLLDAAKRKDGQNPGLSRAAAQALAIKMAEDKEVVTRRNGETVNLGNEGRSALKAAGLDPVDVLNAQKADELNYSTQVGFGDEWVGVQYSNRLWERIRAITAIVDKIPSVEVPQGVESIVIPLEGADPTWYKVPQTTDLNATTGRPNATVPASKLATDNETLTVAKMGARTVFSGEMVEDSLIPWVSQLRRQLEQSGAEMLEHVVIDGDTDATNATNINDIDGTPAATELFLLFNGFRKLALVTNTANSRSAAGSLTDEDFLATIKLMGPAGLNAQDKSKVELILDANTYWKALTLASVKTQDVNSQATIENGTLTRLWGYPVRQSYWMHAESAKRMAETTGKIDQTDSDNTTGAILAVRYDQWLLGYKRRMTIKLQEFPDADATQIVALARVGMVYRDVEAAAETYNVGVA